MDDIAYTWCRMWNDDPALVGSIATQDIRVWFGGAGSSDVEGVAKLADFVVRFRVERGVRFTPVTVAVDDRGERLAYTWKALLPDGGERGGIDFYTLRDGRIAENWSILGGRPLSVASPAAGGSADIAGACEAWVRLWNGEVDVHGLVDPGFRIWFGSTDERTGVDAFAEFVATHRAGRPDLRYATHRDPIVDTARQLAAMTWTVTSEEGVRGGIDVLRFADGALVEVWSVTGEKDFSF